MTSLHNVFVEDLIDELGSLAELKKDCEARTKELREEVLRRGLTHAAGHKYTVTVAHMHRTSLNTDLIKDTMPPEWVKAMSKTTEVSQVTTNRLALKVA